MPLKVKKTTVSLAFLLNALWKLRNKPEEIQKEGLKIIEKTLSNPVRPTPPGQKK